MTGRHTPKSYIVKADKALSAARLLVKAENADGACNRAYYAMFDAAHAALFALGVEELTKPIKTHSGLITKFGQEVVLTGHLPAQYGEHLNRAEDLRRLADYGDDSVELADAALSVERAEAFVAAVKKKFRL
ncbi:hypothetical protein BH10PSE6_BH10PSE6_18460 [soil metagenome]